MIALVTSLRIVDFVAKFGYPLLFITYCFITYKLNFHFTCFRVQAYLKPSYVVLVVFSLLFYEPGNQLRDFLLELGYLVFIYRVCQLVFPETFPFLLLYLHKIDHVLLAYIYAHVFPLDFSAEL